MSERRPVDKSVYRAIFIAVIMLQLIAAFYFCTRKTGFHYDEYYSYYSSNVSAGLTPEDNGWASGREILDEFRVLDGEGFNYGMVKLMQTYDVHPPMYYFVLHTVCSFTGGIFSKWQGLAVNLIFHLLSIVVLSLICGKVYEDKGEDAGILSVVTVTLYGFSPAILSGVMFIRMYVMLTFLCLLTIYVHILALKEDDIYGKKIRNLCIAAFVLTFTGTQTHYYFYVFMFFTAAYTALYLLRKKGFKESAIYAASILGSIAVSILFYPAMLSHIFRGYRGTEATQAFFDMGNLRERAGLFIGLLDEYLLPHCFYIILLCIFLGIITIRFYKTKGESNPVTGLLLTVTIGYFAVVLKTALTNAEEAVRYEMPVYGLLILLLLYGFYIILVRLTDIRRAKRTFPVIISVIFAAVMLILQIQALVKGKVLFLYEDDISGIEWAAEHKNYTVVYVYNPLNQWMIWDDSMELMQYDRIYFVSADSEDEISDTGLLSADHIYVYAVRSDKAKEKIDELVKSDTNVTEASIVRELQYADLYELR